MIRNVLAASAALLLAACFSAHPVDSASTTEANRLKLVNLAHEFDAVVSAQSGEGPAAQLAALDARFDGRVPGFYGSERFGDRAEAVDRVRRDILAHWPEKREAALAVADQFAGRFDEAIDRFETAVGPLPTERPVFLLMSFGEFDGATRDFGNGEHLYFGADAISQYYPGASTMPFLQHELFHIYHSQRMDDCPEIWCSLWNEGLATYTAERLNPGASDVELGLHLPKPIRPALESQRNEAICAVRSRLELTGSEAYNPLFTGMADETNPFPARYGYLVGLWLAERLGEGHDLAEMAEWHGEDLHQRIVSGLAAMSDCS